MEVAQLKSDEITRLAKWMYDDREILLIEDGIKEVWQSVLFDKLADNEKNIYRKLAYRIKTHILQGREFAFEKQCEICNGTGTNMMNQKCDTCNAKGMIYVYRMEA